MMIDIDNTAVEIINGEWHPSVRDPGPYERARALLSAGARTEPTARDIVDRARRLVSERTPVAADCSAVRAARARRELRAGAVTCKACRDRHGEK